MVLRAAEILRALVLSALAHRALFRSAVISPPTDLADMRGDIATQAPGGLAGAGSRRSGLLQSIAVILVVLWLLGFVTSYTMGGFIHILLIIAIAIVLIRVIQGRRPV